MVALKNEVTQGESISRITMTETDTLSSSDSGAHLSPPAKTPVPSKRLSAGPARAQWAPLLVALPFAIQAIVYMRYLIRLIPVQNEAPFGYPEGASVYAFLTALQTHHLYLRPFDFPWNAQLYGPIFYMLGAFFARIFHGAPRPVTESMRLVSFASLIGSMIIVGFMCWRLEQRKTWAMFAVIVGLGCYWITPWASVARPDLLSIFLALLALAIYQAAEGRHRILFLSGAVAAVSVLTKQNTAPMMLALVIDCLSVRKLKSAAIAIAGGTAATTLVLVPLWLRHEPFLENFFVMGHTIYDWHSIPSLLIFVLRFSEIVVIPISIALLGVAFTWRERRYRCVLLATAFASLSNVAALAHIGGNYNYLILPWFLMILFLPAGLKQLERCAAFSLWVPAALFSLAMAILIHQRKFLTMEPPNSIDASAVANLTVLSDNPYLEARSRQPQLLDPYLYNVFSREKVWSDRVVRQRIDAEGYDLLLIVGSDGLVSSEFTVGGIGGTSIWGADILRGMTLRYRDLCETSDQLVLVPRDRPNSITREGIEEIFHEPCRATSRTPQVDPGDS
jgi:hypothetical protein